MSVQINKHSLIRSICRESYAEFLRHFWSASCSDPLDWNWHLEYVANFIQEHVERLMRGEAAKGPLVCNQPPGSSKTTLFSIMLAPWIWTRMPGCCVVGASYSQDVALLHGMKCRDVIRSELYQKCFPEVQVRDDSDKKSQFMTTAGGIRRSIGVGTNITGEHFHILVSDDPIDPIASLSNAELNQVNYWMKNVYAQRVKNKMTALHVLVMQRLAQGDPTAEYLQKKNVQHLCLPASTEFPIHPTELAAKYADGLLDPKRIPRAYLEHIRSPKELGETGYAAQFGQTPIPLSGGRFDVGKLRWGIQPQEFKRVCRAWDKAVTPQKGAGVIGRQPDWTVGTLLGIDMEDRVWVLDVVRMRVDSFRREAMIQRTAERDGVGVTIAVEKEPGAGGVESAEATARRLVGYRVKLIPVSGSKESRADAFSYAVNAGIVFLPAKMREGNRWVGWAQDWVEEFSYFPNGRHDDQVDSASTAYNQIARKKIEVGALL